MSKVKYDPNKKYVDPKQEEAYNSKVLAQATIKEKEQDVLITIHEGSDQTFSYFVSYAAKNAPRSEWQLKWVAPVGSGGKSIGFWEYANSVASRRSESGVNFVKTKYFTDPPTVLHKVSAMMHAYSIRYRPPRLKGKSYAQVLMDDKVRQGQYLESLLPDPDVVEVYVDDCPKCMKRHRCAHYPSGKIFCLDVTDLKNNPTLHYMYHKKGVFTFGFNTSGH